MTLLILNGCKDAKQSSPEASGDFNYFVDQFEDMRVFRKAILKFWWRALNRKNCLDGKTYVKINDYNKLRNLFGDLLKEIQRVKSEGDFESGKKIIEDFGVKVDAQLHTEILERYAKLNLAPYTGFVNPMLIPVYDTNGGITDITVEYLNDYLSQMMYYGKNYSFLPVKN